MTKEPAMTGDLIDLAHVRAERAERAKHAAQFDPRIRAELCAHLGEAQRQHRSWTDFALEDVRAPQRVPSR